MRTAESKIMDLCKCSIWNIRLSNREPLKMKTYGGIFDVFAGVFIMYVSSFSNRFNKKESSIKRLETLVSRDKDYDVLSRLNNGDVLTVSVNSVMFRLCRYGSSLYAFRVKDNQLVHCEYSKTKNAMFIWNCWVPMRKLKRAGW